ncbi:MAG: DUF2263 domain-containing protein [Gammaproteobacteria bacterium]|nr:DUF2263 domain-containing protein [Gammaproteobacteria bacterium]
MPLPPIQITTGRDDIHTKRIGVIIDTLHQFATRPEKIKSDAAANLARWKAAATATGVRGPGKVEVIQDDWGVATQKLTAQYGETFAVLNMANAYTPGGGCDQGMIAQEENMYRRSDCRLRVSDHEIGEDGRSYTAATTALVNGTTGRVAFDKDPRYCIKGPERPGGQGDGYEQLVTTQIFPFYELRSAAQDLRDKDGVIQIRLFDSKLARRKIAAQLETLIAHGQRHVVLSAFGCGAFGNPPEQMAEIYREELAKRAEKFDVVVFAIYYPGYGPNNFTHFSKEFTQKPVTIGRVTAAVAGPAAVAVRPAADGTRRAAAGTARPVASVAVPAGRSETAASAASKPANWKRYITTGIIVALVLILVGALVTAALIPTPLSIALLATLAGACFVGLVSYGVVSASKKQPSVDATTARREEPIEIKSACGPNVPAAPRPRTAALRYTDSDIPQSDGIRSVAHVQKEPTVTWIPDQDSTKTTKVAMISFDKSMYSETQAAEYAAQFNVLNAETVTVRDASAGGQATWNIYLGEARLRCLASEQHSNPHASSLAKQWLGILKEERDAIERTRAARGISSCAP